MGGSIFDEPFHVSGSVLDERKHLYQDRALAVIQPDQPGPGRGPDLILPVRCSNGKEIDAVIQPVFLSDGVLITIHPKRGDY